MDVIVTMIRPLVLLTAVFSAASVLAQAPLPAVDPGYTEEVAVNYVMIPFTALGSRGTPLIDLRSRDVALYVDGRQVATDLFEKSMNAPVSWTILLDGSGSMALAGKMEAARAAVNTLLARRRPGDDFALYVFAEGKSTEIVPYTKNPVPITRAMWSVKPWGKTAFFDALADIQERPEMGENPTRAIVLLSDGIDNASHLSRAQVVKLLEGVSVPVYALGLREPAEQSLDPAKAEEGSNLRLLDELAQMTGGKLYVGNRPQALATAMDGIEKNLRAQYLIGFSPTGRGAVKYRRISLKLAGRARTVRVRAGYRGTEPPALSATNRGSSKRNERKKSS